MGKKLDFENPHININLFPLGSQTFEKQHPLEIFNEYQKSVCALKLVSENKIIMVDQSGASDNFYDLNLGMVDQSRSYFGNLYDLNLGLFQFVDEEPTYLNTDKFLRARVQSKFLNGESFYTKEELPLLKQWIQEKGAKHLRDLFMIVINFKEDSKARFSNSILDKALTS